MANMDLTIKWYEDRKGKVTYSMGERRGPDSYDCSSALYLALIQGGFFPSNFYIGNTDSLFNDLAGNGWIQLSPNAQGNFDTQRGDVFIWGIKGVSGGSLGHTGLFVDADNIDHCSYGYNGIATSNYDWLRSINGYPTQTFYRFMGTPVNNPTDQVVEVGSFIKFDSIFAVDDLQDISDVWQVRTNILCPVGFTWADNGIPAVAAVEVNHSGYATPDQVLDVGSLYKIPGKFQVLDVGESSGRWLAKISFSGLSFWIDLEHATEVSGDDNGTPVPQSIPLPPVSTPVTLPQPVPAPVPTQTVPIPTPVQTPVTEKSTYPSGNIIREVVEQLESNKTIAVNILITFGEAAYVAWATTNFSLDRLAVSGAIGAGLSGAYNLVVKPAAKTLYNKYVNR